MAHPAQQHALLHTAKGLTKEHFKVVADHPVPTAGKGELLVRVKAAALNPVDWKMANIGFIIQSYPVVLGCDLAGVVEHVGEGVADFKVGDEVYAFTKLGSHRQGAFQQHAVVEARMASHKPKALSFAQVATIGVGALTAADGLFLHMGLKAPGEGDNHGKYILVWGAASSVGAYAVQLAALAGLKVIATASPKNFDYVKSLGAQHVVDYNSPHAVEEIKKIAGGKLTLAYDVISPATATLAASALTTEEPAQLAYCAGAPTNPPANVKVSSVFIGGNYESAAYPATVKHLAALFDQGKLKTNVVEPLHGGLNGIVDGLLRLQKGVSGVKLVAEL
uniref:Predicted protein n=1 Tax=Hordeum vulgare subsp. vulgare TaxID=112509 RepID=F2E6Y4_HORVV|nr:predicted protein [Hordeum vulgare subsp. vulgare]